VLPSNRSLIVASPPPKIVVHFQTGPASISRSETMHGGRSREFCVSKFLSIGALRAGLSALVLASPLAVMAALNQAAFIVNAGQSAGEQRFVNAATGWNGDTAVLWRDDVTMSVQLQRYFAEGGLAGDTMALNRGVSDVAIDGAGNYTLVKYDFAETGRLIAAGSYKRDGSVRVPAFLVSTGPYFNSTVPRLGIDRQGRFAVAWGGTSSTTPAVNGLFMRLYGADGVATSPELMIHRETVNPYYSDQFAVKRDDTGGAVVCWERYQGNSKWNILCRRYAANGTPVTAEFQIHTFANGQQGMLALAVNGKGDTVVVWGSFGQDGDAWGVYGQRLDPTGKKVGAEFRVNDITPGDQREPGVGITDEGNFVVTYSQYDSAARIDRIYMKQYRANGTAVGPAVVRASTPEMYGVPQQPSTSPGGKVSLYWEVVTDLQPEMQYTDVAKLRYTLDTQPATSLLMPGVAKTGVTAAAGAWTYHRVTVPSGATKLTLTLTGTTVGNGDLYARLGAFPTTTSYNGRSVVAGNNQTLVITAPTPGIWYVGVYGVAAFSNDTLTATIQ
jgi:hypothetical protein